jgi:hypothetical protein
MGQIIARQEGAARLVAVAVMAYGASVASMPCFCRTGANARGGRRPTAACDALRAGDWAAPGALRALAAPDRDWQVAGCRADAPCFAVWRAEA